MARIFTVLLFAAVAVAQQPVVVELFTSEGCSSCPPADKLLSELDRTQPVKGAHIIVLSEHVDYWNSLGWTDPFSSMKFSERQNLYARNFRVNDVYTPQAVIDGRWEAVGGNGAKVVAAIERAAQEKKIPVTLSASRDGDHIHVKVQMEGGKGDVYVAIAEKQVNSKVLAGENTGRFLEHTAAVRSLTRLTESEMDLKVNGKWGALRVVAFVSDGAGGKILGAAVADL